MIKDVSSLILLKPIRIILIILLIIGNGITLAVSRSLPYDITGLLRRYTREVTVLEIGKKNCPYFSALLTHNVQYIALSVGGVNPSMLEKVSGARVQTSTLLGPKKISFDMFSTLASCEHFDIVIVHDLALDIISFRTFLATFLRLGEHTFIEAVSSDQERACKNMGMSRSKGAQETCYFYTYKAKTRLEKARFTQKLQSSKVNPVYRITSSFDSKFFSKGPFFKPIPWINGINMVTFVMMEGVYPTDAMIRSQLASFKTAYKDHNDLVLGNIILKGTKLIPIDFNDDRRSVNSLSCIAAALRAFQIGNRRLKDPLKWINDYYKSV